MASTSLIGERGWGAFSEAGLTLARRDRSLAGDGDRVPVAGRRFLVRGSGGDPLPGPGGGPDDSRVPGTEADR